MIRVNELCVEYALAGKRYIKPILESHHKPVTRSPAVVKTVQPKTVVVSSAPPTVIPEAVAVAPAPPSEKAVVVEQKVKKPRAKKVKPEAVMASV